MQYDAFFSLMALIALGAIFFGPWQSVWIDWARQVAFSNRDAIFDMAREGKLDFHSREYKTIRTSLEQLIRFAHELTLLQFVFASIMPKGTFSNSKSSQLRAAIDSIHDEQARTAVSSLIRHTHLSMLVMMAARSPFTFYLVVAYWIALHVTRRLPRFLMSWVYRGGEFIQKEAERAPIT